MLCIGISGIVALLLPALSRLAPVSDASAWTDLVLSEGGRFSAELALAVVAIHAGSVVF